MHDDKISSFFEKVQGEGTNTISNAPHAEFGALGVVCCHFVVSLGNFTHKEVPPQRVSCNKNMHFNV